MNELTSMGGVVRLAVLTAVLLLASPVSLAFDPGTGVVYGFGFTATCDTLTSDLEARPSIAPEIYKNYIAGFISGINSVTPRKPQVGEGRDIAALFGFIKKYCEEHPRDEMATALSRLIVELAGKKPSELNEQSVQQASSNEKKRPPTSRPKPSRAKPSN